MTRPRLKGILCTAGALAIAVATLSPAMRVGFLADDFYVIGRVDELAREEPGIGARLGAGVVRRWSDRFHAFRPLTVATVQLDHALHGIDARGFRVTNVVLWLLGALLFSKICAAYLGVTSSLGRAAALLAFALWPVAVEPLGWTLIREDSLLLDSALAAALLLKTRRAQPWLVALPLALALASKETAIVLPFMLAAVDAALLLREGAPPRRLAGALARRSWSWFLVLGAWWVSRRAAGGGDTWAGGSYADVLFSSGAPIRFLTGLAGVFRALILPVNLARGSPAARITLVVLLAVPAVLVFTIGLRRARRSDLVAGAAWFAAPLAILLPFYSVSPALESVRIAALPGVAWLFAVVGGAARWARTHPRLASAACVIFLAVEGFALRFNLGAYVEASRRVEQMRSDASEWPAGRLWLLRSREGEAFAPSLMIHEGAYIFSASIHDALRPPFQSAHVDLRVLSADDERHLAEIVGKDDDNRGAIAVLVHETAGPRLRFLCDTAWGAPVGLAPPHGTTVRRAEIPILAVAPDGASAGDVCEVVVAEPEGTRWTARRAVGPEHLRDGVARIEFRSVDFGLPESFRPLEAVHAPVFIWSASLTRGPSLVGRSAYAVVSIAEEP